MPDTIKIYRYLPAEWALRTLQERRLKVARLKELNDPFEWRVGNTAAEPGHQITLKDAFERSFDRLNDMIGILCFSSEISDPVIWSHYSAGHQGIALEFDHFITPALHEVSYDDKRPVFDVDHHVKSGSDSSYPRSLFGQFLHKKAPSWHYEREYRVALDLGSDCVMDGAHYFSPIPEDFLNRVILGVRCTATEADVERSLKQGGLAPVPIIRARMSDTTYEILCD